MSAQIIRALRKRAEILDGVSSDRRTAAGVKEAHGQVADAAAGQAVASLEHWLAEQFRSLADEAEGYLPRSPL